MNAAMALGGIPLVVQTLEGMFGTRLDHVAVIDFEGFKAMTDALGGVNVNVPQAFNTKQFSFPAGKQQLTGEEALAFVRERKAFSDGDYQRVKNQQLFLKALMTKFLTARDADQPRKDQQPGGYRLAVHQCGQIAGRRGRRWFGDRAPRRPGLRCGQLHAADLGDWYLERRPVDCPSRRGGD